MQRLINIEFFNSPEGEVQIRDEKGVRTYMEEDKELTDALFSVIELDYPKAFYSTEQMEEYKGYIDLIATMHKTWKVEKVKDK